MSSLQGKTLSETYKDLLQISNNNIGVDNTCRYIEDGEGTVSILAISQNYVGIGTTSQGITEGKLHVSGNSLFSGDITTTGSIIFSPGSYTALHTGSNLSSLADVDATAPSDGQTLLYDSSSSSWTPSTIPASTLENLSDTYVDNATLMEGDILEWSAAGMYWRSRSAPAALPSTTTSGAFLTYDTAVNAWEPNTSFINSSGRLGIGTGSALSVSADLHISHTNASTLRAPIARMELTGQSNVNFDIFGDEHASLPGWFQIGGWNTDVGIAIVTDVLADVEAGTSRKGMFLKNGNIGIGTTNPTAKLEIFGDSQSIKFTRNQGDRSAEMLYDGSVFLIKSPPSDRLSIADSSSNELFTVNPNSGNVGIGVNNPGSLLHIAGGDSDARDITLQYTGTAGASEQAIVWKDFRGQTNAQIANILWGDAVNQPSAGLAFRVTNLSQTIIDAITIKPDGSVVYSASDNSHDSMYTLRRGFRIDANVRRRIRIILSNYEAAYIRIAAQRTNSGDSMVWYHGYFNYNFDQRYTHTIDSRLSSGTISVSPASSINGDQAYFDFDFNVSASPATGSIVVENVAGEATVQVTTY